VAAAADGVAAAGGVPPVSEGVVTGAVDAAAAAAQCSEIIFTSVTAKLLPAGVELAPLALWLLVAILKMWPVLSSTTV
jgi:hypothetical protein